MRPASASRTAAARTGPIRGRQSSASARAASEGQIDFSAPRSEVRRRMTESSSASDGMGLVIHPFSDALAPDFHDINAAWISRMFVLEPTDREVLEHPRARIVAPGGDILFVEAAGLGIVGTCALQKTGPGQFELTKMGVRESARGRGAGAFLLRAALRRAEALGAARLYLLTNSRCEAAIHLYETHGFVHDPEIMREFGARYARCDIAMLYRPRPAATP